MGLRKALARWLDPSIEDDRQALWRIRSDLADAWWWCGEFPQVAATAAWVRLTDQRRWMPWEKYHAMVMNGTGPRWEFTAQIGDFREWLRRTSIAGVTEAVRNEALRKPDFTPVPAESSVEVAVAQQRAPEREAPDEQPTSSLTPGGGVS